MISVIKHTGICILVAALCGAMAGCWANYTKPLHPAPSTQAERNFEALWLSARSVLKKYDFHIDRQDRRDGIMTTYAAPGGQFFEFWRKDAATHFSRRENTFQTILRAARVKINRVEGTDRFDFEIEIRMARTDRDPKQFSDTSQYMVGGQTLSRKHGYSNVVKRVRFGDLARKNEEVEELKEDEDPALVPQPPKRKKRRKTEDMIVPLGRDSDLEDKIANDIRRATANFDPKKAGNWVSM